MRLNGPILVATALGKASDEAIRQAYAISRTTGHPLFAVHVLPELTGNRPLFPEMRMLDADAALRTEQVALDAMRDQWTRVIGGTPTPGELKLESGTAHSGVLHYADEIGAGLIVVGSGSRALGVSLGGVAERIVRHAHCPVLVASTPTGGPVLSASDFSDPSLPAIHWGASEAERRGAKFAVLHSVDLHITGIRTHEGFVGEVPAVLIEARQEDARARLARIEEEFKPSAGVILKAGPAADAIVETANAMNADLIVIGTHGRTGFKRFALGSVAEGVVRHARGSVLVVRLAR